MPKQGSSIRQKCEINRYKIPHEAGEVFSSPPVNTPKYGRNTVRPAKKRPNISGRLFAGPIRTASFLKQDPRSSGPQKNAPFPACFFAGRPNWKHRIFEAFFCGPLCMRQKYETRLEKRLHMHNYLQPKLRPLDRNLDRLTQNFTPLAQFTFPSSLIPRSKTDTLRPNRKSKDAICVTSKKRAVGGTNFNDLLVPRDMSDTP